MGRRRRATLALTAVAAAALAVPAAASASRASVDNDVLRVVAGGGERNVIALTGRGNRVTVTDSAGIRSIDSDCTQVNATQVRCTRARSLLIVTRDLADRVTLDDSGSDAVRQGATIRAGGGADRIFGGAQADLLYGGAGPDRLFGKAGDDKLYGRRGRDRLFGGEDEDQLYARDRTRDPRLVCGPGDNAQEFARRDRRDPRPRGC